MIIETLFVIFVILMISHIFVHFSVGNNKEKTEAWNFAKEAENIARGESKEEKIDTKTETEIILPVNRPKVNESSFMNYGKVIANEQKIKILNHRFDNLERAFSEFASKKVNDSDVDLEKIDFKIKVLESEIEKIKYPKEKEHTFYGKKNDPLEKEIRSLVFNTKKK